jgi:hypothetical protein
MVSDFDTKVLGPRYTGVSGNCLGFRVKGLGFSGLKFKI